MRKTAATFHQEEVDTAWLYGAIADLEPDPRLAEVFRRVGATEAAHARRGEEQLAAGRAPPATLGPSRRARLLAWLSRRLGPQFVLPTLIARERSGARAYAGAGAGAAVAEQEGSTYEKDKIVR
jgi:hypothetical protein